MPGTRHRKIPRATRPLPAKFYRRNPTTSEALYTEEERRFLVRLERYKRLRGRPFPTCGEVLAVLKSLGYRRVEKPTALPNWPLVIQ